MMEVTRPPSAPEARLLHPVLLPQVHPHPSRVPPATASLALPWVLTRAAVWMWTSVRSLGLVVRAVRTPWGASCSCMEGYVMQNNSCLADGEATALHQVRGEGVGVRSMEYFPWPPTCLTLLELFDSLGGRVYWTDVEAGKETLMSAGLDGSGLRSWSPTAWTCRKTWWSTRSTGTSIH